MPPPQAMPARCRSRQAAGGRRESGDRRGRAARTPAGMTLLVELAETLQCSGARPAHSHELSVAPSAYDTASASLSPPSGRDVILALEAQDFWTHHAHDDRPSINSGMESQPITKPGAKLITISAIDLYHKATIRTSGAMPKWTWRSRRCRSHAAGVDRSREAADHAGPQERAAGSRREVRPKRDGRPASALRTWRLRLGRQPDQHGAP